jgi:hypothetical protein
MVDLWEVQRRFGGNDPNYDIDCSGRIDMVDLWITQKNFGKIDP